MEKTTDQAPQPSITPNDAANDLMQAMNKAVEADSLALCHINNVVKLAAFACEARRAIQGINEALRYQDDARGIISDAVPAFNNWREFEDVAGDVLQQVSNQIEALARLIEDRPLYQPASLRAAAMAAHQAEGRPAE